MFEALDHAYAFLYTGAYMFVRLDHDGYTLISPRHIVLFRLKENFFFSVVERTKISLYNIVVWTVVAR